MPDIKTKIHTNITAIVVTYNRLDLLKRCIQALLNQTLQPTRLVIIDNASTDGTYEAVTKLAEKHSCIVYRRLTENKGGAGGFHAGFMLSADKYDGWIWVMDDDACPDPQALEKLSVQAENPSNIYGSTAIDENLDNNELCWPAEAINLGEDNKRYKFLKDFDKTIEVSSIPFLGLLIHTHLIKQIGYPEKDFFIYGDDVEYCQRARSDKAKIFLVPGSILRHPLPARINISLYFTTVPLLILSAWKRYYETRNKLLIARKYFGIKLWTHTMPGIFLRWVVCMISQPERIEQSKAFVYGIIDGLLNNLHKRYRPS